jgi:hypothetical protein
LVMRKFWRRKRRDESPWVHSSGSYADKLARMESWGVDRDTEKRTHEDREDAEDERRRANFFGP